MSKRNGFGIGICSIYRGHTMGTAHNYIVIPEIPQEIDGKMLIMPVLVGPLVYGYASRTWYLRYLKSSLNRWLMDGYSPGIPKSYAIFISNLNHPRIGGS